MDVGLECGVTVADQADLTRIVVTAADSCSAYAIARKGSSALEATPNPKWRAALEQVARLQPLPRAAEARTLPVADRSDLRRRSNVHEKLVLKSKS